MNSKKFQKREIFKGKYLSLNIEKGKINGKEISFEIVGVPDSVAVLAFTSKDKIILIRQYRHSVGKTLWEIPAGHIDNNETPEHAAKRELEEETGLEAKKIRKIGKVFVSPGYSTECMHFFVAEVLRKGKQNLEEGELIKEVKIFKSRDTFKMVKDKKIIDAKTILGLLWLKD